MRTLLRLWACFSSCSFALLPLLTATPALRAQTAAAKAATAAESSSGFSIETEMLTYRALESNSEAIACDIAAYLRGGTANFSSPKQGAVCSVTGSGGANSTVMVLPFDHNVYSDFQIWRSDMQTMAEFEKRGASACSTPPAPPPTSSSTPSGVSGRGLTTAASTATAVGGVMGAMTPAGAMLSTGSGVLSLFARDQSAAPVGGTIEDQAMMDNVSRELRNVDVHVMMPSIYTPFALSSIDPARSPFLVALDKLLHTRDCLVSSKGASDADVKNIDEFLATISSGPSSSAAAVKPAAASASGGTTPAPAASAAAAGPAASAPSHLQSALSADGLAQRLGADPETGQIPASAPQHILLLKALESGGSVSKNTTIFGTKLSYSGGSVGTYALFDLSGSLECSGNVYDYAGYIPAKQFQEKLRAYTVNPAQQVIFQRGGCRAK